MVEIHLYSKGGGSMKLPEVKNKKLINSKEFAKVAKKVAESLEEEMKYMVEKRLKNESNISSGSYPVS
jgi:hypothetical protein